MFKISTDMLEFKSYIKNRRIKMNKKMLEDWIEDYAYLLHGVQLMFFHKKPPKHYAEGNILDKVPVVLIPGVLGTWAFMKDLGDKISSRGYPVFVIPDLGLNLFDIPSSSKKLDLVIEKILLKEAEQRNINKSKGVILVAHSKGGLIGKYSLMRQMGAKILGLIAIATPFSGSGMVEFIEAEPFQELSKNSNIIKELEEAKEINKKIISIIPEFDNHVWAEKGSFLEGAENIKVPVSGHHKIIFDKDVLEKVIECIGSLSSDGA